MFCCMSFIKSGNVANSARMMWRPKCYTLRKLVTNDVFSLHICGLSCFLLNWLNIIPRVNNLSLSIAVRFLHFFNMRAILLSPFIKFMMVFHPLTMLHYCITVQFVFLFLNITILYCSTSTTSPVSSSFSRRTSIH